MSFSRFFELWTHPEFPPSPVEEADLVAAEAELGVRLPEDFRQGVLDLGLPHLTIALLDLIVERDLDLSCPSDFLAPAEIVAETRDGRSMGMPPTLIGFATDFGGNLFCFDAAALTTARTAEAPVWLFDHDLDTAQMVAPSFSQWIRERCEIDPEGAFSRQWLAGR